MKKMMFVFALLVSFSAKAEWIDFNFDELRNCTGEFGYQKIFLLDGRAENEHLVRDLAANVLVRDLDIQDLRDQVSDVYSMEMSKNYVNYDDLRDGKVKRLALVMVKNPSTNPHDTPGGPSEYRDHILLLFVSEGDLEGHVLSAHPVNFDFDSKVLDSPRFVCKAIDEKK